MPPISVEGLTKRYGSLVAVNDLSFHVRAGAVTGFLGPNGAGKTTTLKMLLGLVAPTEGLALVHGRPYRDLQWPLSTVGAVLEGGAFHPGRTGRAHLRVLAAAAQLPSARVEEVLGLVGLEQAAGKRVRSYSLGMRQRLGLAAALLGEPDILVLDEPANGLDPAGMRWLRTFLRAFAADGGTVLISSHVLAELSQTVDDVVVIGHGRLLAQGAIDDLLVAGGSLEDAYLNLTDTTEALR